MANNKKQEETRTSIDNLNDNLTSLGANFQANRKLYIGVTILVCLIAVVILVYIFAFRRPGQQKAMTEAGLGDIEYLMNQNDSLALEHYKIAAETGYEGGNRARLMIAEIEYKNGNYEEALSYLKDYKVKDNILGAAAMSLKGDCYVNLDQLDNAVDAFKKAVKDSDKNPYYTPYFMMKLARVYKAQGNNKGVLDIYEEINEKYPQYFEGSYNTLEQELESARANAAE